MSEKENSASKDSAETAFQTTNSTVPMQSQERSSDSIYFPSSVTYSRLPPFPMAYCRRSDVPVKQLSITSPPQAVFEELRPVLQDFVKQHEYELNRLASYVCTIATVDGHNGILLMAENAITFRINQDYKDRDRVFIRENKVRFATGKRYHLAYVEKLCVGAQIGVLNDKSSFGTLGGFVKLKDVTYGLTCFHVVGENTQFQQPSHQSMTHFKIDHSKTKFKEDKSYLAGSSSELGQCRITEAKHWLDYQMLALEREVKEPVNEIGHMVTLKAPSLAIDLNDSNVANQFRGKSVQFGKVGAATGMTEGYLHNGSRQDCFVKIGSNDSIRQPMCPKLEYTLEFAIQSTDHAKDFKFASYGDSGSLVYIDDLDSEHDTVIVGMVFAVTTDSPFFAFVTPIWDILNDIESRQGTKLTIQ